MSSSGVHCGRSAPRRRQLLISLSAVILGVTLTGCGNWISVTDAGQLGLTVDEAGQPVIAVVTCTTSTPWVDLAEGRKKTDPEDKVNVERGHWQARHSFAGVRKLSLTAPGTGWKTSKSAGTFEPGTLFLVDGGTTQVSDSSLGGVDFRTGDLARLSPDVVQINGKITTWKAFAAYKCDN